jgi:uncharacterized RDD family membrane protein YckC
MFAIQHICKVNIMADEIELEVNSQEQMEYQGIGIRLVSLVIDSIIFGLIFGALENISGAGGMQRDMFPWYWGVLYFVIYITYFTLLEGSKGQTVGKMITKIKVVREDGSPIDMSQAFTRNILRIIDGLFAYLIGAILIWRSDKQQRLGDRVARTVVVKAR